MNGLPHSKGLPPLNGLPHPNGLSHTKGLAHSNGLFANAAQSDSHMEALLSNLGPATPSPLGGNDGHPLPVHPLNNAFNGLSPSKGLMLGPPPPPSAQPSLSTCTSLYVKNLPPETDRLWLYER